MCSIKRENNDIVLPSTNIILDIEGTTTSITFVKDVLFPYVRNHLEAYVKENWDSEDFQATVNSLRIQANEDKEKKLDGVVEIPEDGEKDNLAKAVIKNVLWQMDIDSKSKSLKDLQGLIMEVGYKKGELKGHVYEDVEPNIKSWVDLGKSVYIYSSGSVRAQKLLYGYSEKGDLLPYIKGHFDTTVGKKGDVESYKKILEQISSSPSETVFFTDVPNEARAAKKAGLMAVLLSREGNAPLTDEDKGEFQVITSFSEIQFENNSKKRKVCTNSDEKNDNKSVESCEVSLKLPKDLTNPTLTQEDVEMEVEESSTEEKSDEKLNENSEDKPQLQNAASENCDVKIKITEVIVEAKTSEKENEVVGSQKNKDSSDGGPLPEEMVSGDLKTENIEELDKNGEVTPDTPSIKSDVCQKEKEPTTDRREIENVEEETITVINKSESCDKKALLEVNPEMKGQNNGNISNNSQISRDITQVQKSNENPEIAQQNGNLTHNSCDTTENMCEPTDLDIEMVVEKSSEIQKLNPDNNTEKNVQSKPDILNDLSPPTNENGITDENKLLKSSLVSTNDSVSSTVTNTSVMQMDGKTCPKESTNSEGMLNNISHPDIPQKDLNEDSTSTDEKRCKAVDPESNKDSTTISKSSTVDCKTDVKIPESSSLKDVNEPKASDEGISDDIQSVEKRSEISSKPSEQNGIETQGIKPEMIDTNIKPCIEAAVEKPSSETLCESRENEKSSSVQAQTEKIETDDSIIQSNNKTGEVGNEVKSGDESFTETKKGSKSISVEAQTERIETDDSNVQSSNGTDEVGNGIKSGDKSCTESGKDSKSRSEEAQIENMQTNESNVQSSNGTGEVGIEAKSGDESCLESEKESKFVSKEAQTEKMETEEPNVQSNNVTAEVGGETKLGDEPCTESKKEAISISEQAQTEKMETNDSSVQSNNGNGEVGIEAKSGNESCTESKKGSTSISEEAHTEKMETDEPNVQSNIVTGEVGDKAKLGDESCTEAKKESTSISKEAQTKKIERNDSKVDGSSNKTGESDIEVKSGDESYTESKIESKYISDQAQTEKMETNDSSVHSNNETGEVGNEAKSVDELCTGPKKESKLEDSVSAPNTVVETKAVSSVSAETQNQSARYENSFQSSVQHCGGEKDETPELSQKTDKKTTKEPKSDLNNKESFAASDVRNDVKEDNSNNLDEKEANMSVNGKIDGAEKSIECSNGKDLKDESTVHEIKKCEVQENPTIATVVEA